MKRIIYTLTAIFSAAATVIFIIEYIEFINNNGKFFFSLYYCTEISVWLALGILSAVQLKKHMPRLMLVLCGYAFIASSMVYYSFLGNSYLGVLLLMAAALMPAIYELSRYGMLVRQQPKAGGQSSWRWLRTAAIVLAIYRILPIIMQTIVFRYDFNNFLGNHTADIMGIFALICFAVFCSLMNRRTSILYRMFFTGCILFDLLQTVLPQYGFFSYYFAPDTTVRMLFVVFEVLYVLFGLLILIHALITRRDSLITQEHTEITQQTDTPAV